MLKDKFNKTTYMNYLYNKSYMIDDIVNISIKLKKMRIPFHLFNYFKEIDFLYRSNFPRKQIIKLYEILYEFDTSENVLTKGSYNNEEFKLLTSFRVFKPLVLLLGLTRFNEILRILLTNKNEITLHDFLNSFPKKIHYKNEKNSIENAEHNKIYGDRIYKAIKNNLKRSRENFYILQEFLNFQKTQSLPLKKALQHIGKIKLAKKSISESHYIPLVIENLFPNVNRNHLRFTKSIAKIHNIGTETGCCFRIGGLAQSLVEATIKSPIACIAIGKTHKKESIWFSMVWEIVILNKETNTFELNLILDNIESLSRIDFDVLLDELKAMNTFSKIYLGSSRNDISNWYSISDKYPLIDRPYPLAGSEKEFGSYNYDDSLKIHTIIENNEKPKKAYVYAMNDEELHRLKYIESIIYGVSDPVFLKIKYIKEISFSIRNDFEIYGYFIVSRLKSSRLKSTYEILDEKIKNKNTEEEFYEKSIYIDDLFLSNVSSLKAFLKFINNIFKPYIKRENIKYIVYDSNEYSKRFIKRINKSGLGIKFIESNGTSFTSNRFMNKISLDIDFSKFEILNNNERYMKYIRSEHYE